MSHLSLLKLGPLFVIKDDVKLLACLLKRLAEFDIHVASESGATYQVKPTYTINVIEGNNHVAFTLNVNSAYSQPDINDLESCDDKDVRYEEEYVQV